MAAGDVAIDGRALGRVELTARSADRAVRFDLRLPTLSADVSGRIGFEPGWPFEARANLRRSQLTSLAALLERTIALPDTSATVTASADVKGQLNRPLESTGVITVPEIEGQLRGRPLRLIQPGRIRFDGRRPTLEEPLRITLGGFSMGLARVRERESGVLVTLEGRIEDGIAFLPPGMLITPWLVEGPVRAQVSLDQDGDRFAIAGDGDATIDRLMRAEGELARGVHLQARIRGSAIEFSGGDGVVLGAPFSATARMPLAWAVPAWLADGVPARRRHLTDRSNSVGASGCNARPGASSTRHQEHEHVGDREGRYGSPRGRAATRRCRGHGHLRGCRGLGRRSRPDPAGTDQAAIRSGAAGSRGTRLEGTSLVPHGLGRYRPSARHRRRVSGGRDHVSGVSPA